MATVLPSPAPPVPASAGPGYFSRRWRARLRAWVRSTPGRLTGLAAVVVVLALLCGATGISTVLASRHEASRLANRTSPAVVDAAQTYALLADADREAAASVLPPGAWSGPSKPYQDDIKTAFQAFTRAADEGVTGATGRQQAQSVNGLLVVYLGDVYGASVPSTDSAAVGLNLVYLAYSADLMREPDGILATVDAFRQDNATSLDASDSGLWALLGLHLAATVALLGAVITAQVFLRRRFRRQVSAGLLAALCAAAAISATLTVATVGSSHRVEQGARETTAIACLWQGRAVAAVADHDRLFDVFARDNGAPRALALPARVDTPANALPDDCPAQDQPTAPAQTASSGTYRALAERYDKSIADRATALDATLAGAAPAAGLVWVMAAGTVVVIALAGVAFWPRVREYVI